MGGEGGIYFQQSNLLLRLNPAPTRDTIVAEVNADVEAGFRSGKDCGSKRNADEELGEGLHGVRYDMGCMNEECEMGSGLIVRT